MYRTYRRLWWEKILALQWNFQVRGCSGCSPRADIRGDAEVLRARVDVPCRRLGTRLRSGCAGRVGLWPHGRRPVRRWRRWFGRRTRARRSSRPAAPCPSACVAVPGPGWGSRWLRDLPVRLLGPLLAGPGRMLVCAHDGEVHRDSPVEVVVGVGLCDQRGEHPLPGAVEGPHPQPVVDASPVAVLLREADPLRSRLAFPRDRVDHFSVIPPPATPPRCPIWG